MILNVEFNTQKSMHSKLIFFKKTKTKKNINLHFTIFILKGSKVKAGWESNLGIRVWLFGVCVCVCVGKDGQRKLKENRVEVSLLRCHSGCTSFNKRKPSTLWDSNIPLIREIACDYTLTGKTMVEFGYERKVDDYLHYQHTNKTIKWK